MESATRLLLLDVLGENKGLREIEIDGKNLQEFYDNLQCDCFDIANRNIGGKDFDIFCDDIGLFVDNPTPSALRFPTGEVELVGNLIFAHHDAGGNTISLSDEDVALIKEHTVIIKHRDTGAKWKVVIVE